MNDIFNHHLRIQAENEDLSRAILKGVDPDRGYGIEPARFSPGVFARLLHRFGRHQWSMPQVNDASDAVRYCECCGLEQPL